MTETNAEKRKNPLDTIVEFFKKFEAIGAVILVIIAVITGVIGFFPKKPIITINNHLALPIRVTVNDNEAYTKLIEGNSSYTFELFSETDFPARVSWELIRNRNGNSFIGEDLKGDFPQVDKGKKIEITNIIGDRTYFYPKIFNNTGKSCRIILNEGLIIEDPIGFSKDGSIIGITGYYKYAKNSNVTLLCGTTYYWRGERNGVNGGNLQISRLSGITELKFP